MSTDYQQISQIVTEHRQEVVQTVVSELYTLRPDLAERYGQRGRQRCLEDTHYHLMYLSEALAVNSVDLFSDYIQWAKVLLAGFNIPTTDLADNLQVMQDVLIRYSPQQAHDTLRQFLSHGVALLATPSDQPASYLNEHNILSELASQYLDALIKGERHRASQMILEAVQQGTPVRDIYLHVFQRSQHEIGRLWQTNKITVAQEHYCTAATQMIMSQLYPYIFSTEKNGRWMVATSVAGELHEIGGRMVADFFEMDGWDTLFLGANTPPGAIVQAVSGRKADVLGISATMSFHVSRVVELIGLVRASDYGEHVKIIVGGYPFNIDPGLWKRVGADAYGRDALEAVALANRLIKGQKHAN